MNCHHCDSEGTVAVDQKNWRGSVNILAVEVETMLFTESNHSSHFVSSLSHHRICLAAVLLTAMFYLSASAQNLTPSRVHALSNDWRSVQALPAQTRIRITGDRKKNDLLR